MKPLNDQVSNEYSCLMIFVGERWRGSVCHGQIGAKLLILVLKSGGHFCTKEPNLWTYKTYLSHCVCDYCCWNGFQKAKKTSGGGTHKYDESTVRTTDFSPYFFLGKWPLKPLLGIVCSLFRLERGFYHEFFSSLVFQAETKAKARVECPLNNAQGKMDPPHLSNSSLYSAKPNSN